MMKKILIFSGTTEGRTLAEKLADAGVAVEVCVATEYGEQMMEEKNLIKVHTGRMDVEEMKKFFGENQYEIIIDATHPFATIVTENIIEAALGLDLEYIRVERLIEGISEDEHIKFFDSVEECIEKLKTVEGKILLTSGSKDLKKFCQDEALRKKIVARILPGIESLQLAYDAGLDGRQIICMHGPFSKEMNINTMKDFEISVLVTKESGKAGGMDEKIDACIDLDKQCFVIRKPSNTVITKKYSVDEAYRKIISPENKVKFSLIGIGMGDKEGLTVKAKEAIEKCDILFGAKRMLEAVGNIIATNSDKYPYYLEKDIMPVILEKSCIMKKEIKAAVLFSGDTGFFSGCEKLNKALKLYENVEVEIIPGASSLSYFSSKIGVSYQDAKIVSTHGVNKDKWVSELLSAVATSNKTFFITSGVSDINLIGELFEKKDLAVKVYVGYELSYENEKIYETDARGCKQISEPGLYVGMIINEAATEKLITPGLSDEEFIRDKVPMTKEEVRILSICKLGLKADSVVYDVGSGTGSIAIEMALLSPSIKVYAIETNKTALDLIKQNSEKFNVSNVEIIEALAPAKFEELPTPTHAFIGGSKGNLKEILISLREKNPNMKVVINAVSMETIVQAQEVFKELNICDVDICMVNISKAKKLGEYNLMQASNPVYIYTFSFYNQRYL